MYTRTRYRQGEPQGNSVAILGLRTIVFDSFNRADSAVSLGTSDTGHAWTALAGTFGIASNQAKLVTDAGTNNNAAVVNSLVADNFTVSVRFTVTGTGRLVWRCTDVANGFMCLVLSPNINLYRLQAGVYNQIGTVVQAVANGDTLAVAVRGNTHQVLLNGSQVIAPTTDAFTPTLTNHGIGESASTATRLDDFRITVP